MTTIAFIGLGNMGGPMAANLVQGRASGDRVRPVRRLLRAGQVRRRPRSPRPRRTASRDADVVITMLPAGRHVVSVWTDILPAVRAGALVIDCSTIDVESAREAHAMAGGRGLASLDAPVSGGIGGRRGSDADLHGRRARRGLRPGRADPVQAMGKRVVHCGEAGAGQAAKICNNMILGISMIGVAEAFVLAEKLGLSHQALFDVASTSSGQCWSLTTYCPVPGPVPTSPANNDYKPGFASALMLKDLKLAQEAALATGAATPLGAQAAQIYDLFNKAGHAGTDFSAHHQLSARPEFVKARMSSRARTPARAA